LPQRRKELAMDSPVDDIDVLIAPYQPEKAVSCPCGDTDRAWVGVELPGVPENGRATVHIVTQNEDDARTHYHRISTEYYLFLECLGDWMGIELNGETIQVQPFTRVAIMPGVRHRVRGKCRIAVVVMPGHDPTDEHFDD